MDSSNFTAQYFELVFVFILIHTLADQTNLQNKWPMYTYVFTVNGLYILTQFYSIDLCFFLVYFLAEIIMFEGLTCVYRSNVDLFFYVVGSVNENEVGTGRLLTISINISFYLQR